MATIRTAIDLQTDFTEALYQVINSINAPQSSVEVVLMVQPDAPDPLVEQPPPVDLAVEPEQPDPVEVPVQWRSYGLDVFMGQGVGRFGREVQSANNMLDSLNQTQSRIAEAAARADLFPADAVTDMNNIQDRLQAIQQRIRMMENTPLCMDTDTVNTSLEQLRIQLEQAVQRQQNLNRAVDNMDVQAANEAYLQLFQTIGSAERYIRDNIDGQRQFTGAIEQSMVKANELMQTLKKTVKAISDNFSAAVELSDQFTLTTTRLNLMNDGLQTTQNLQGMIYLSAERARSSYQATANAVSKLGIMAGDAFGSSEEIVAFVEQVNKQFTIAGMDSKGIDAAMSQFTEAMSSGAFSGKDLEQVPNIIQVIADYMEVPQEKLEDMAAEGLITAGIVKAAMFAAADETNAKFEQMPKTFSQIWNSFQNTALIAFQPVFQQMNEIANSEAFQELVNNALNVLVIIADIACKIFDLMTGIAVDNWSCLSPVIYGVAAALAVYYGWQLAVNAIGAVSRGIHIVMAAAQMIHAAATGALTVATAAGIAAQNGLNAALYACPVTWILVMIIALVILLYAVVAVINKVTGSTVSATGIICGAFMFAAAVIGNVFLSLVNYMIDIGVVIWNFIAAFANFFANVLNDPVAAIARLLFELVDGGISLLKALASSIDTIFGSNFSGAIQGWGDSLSGWVDKTFGQGEVILEKKDASSLHLERFKYGEAWDAGYSFGEGIDESIANFDPSSLFDVDTPNASDYEAGIAGDVGDIAGNTETMTGAMDITGEELKYLRDIAEQEAINRFTTAEIKIEQTNHNTIKNGMDLDGIMSGMTDMVNEAVYISTEGVHM